MSSLLFQMDSPSTNIAHVPNHDKEIYIICIIFMILSITAIILRSVSVQLRKSSHGIDDLLVIVAMVQI